jgi:glycosyltransferase involved in cell wall biosynthesis
MGTERLEQPQDVWVAIPVFNNKDTVRAVAMACRDELPNVVVVDDGSTDTDVLSLLKDTGVVVLKHDRNKGKGRAILTALQYVREHGARYVITIDADGQHHPRDIRNFLPLLADQSETLIIGARRLDAPNRPRSSRFGMRFSDFWLSVETGIAMKDTQSGFRAYPVANIWQINLDGDA